MSRAQKIAIGSLLLFAALVAVMVLRNRQAPALPTGEEHRWADADRCLSCHSVEGGLPRSMNHPVGLDCTRCHGVTR